MTSTSADRPDSTDLTDDAFLGGQLRLLQPRKGYRAGVDPVLLAASVSARAGDTVLELGCGAGAAMLCLATRVPGVALCGIELQPDYAALARQNALRNGIEAVVHDADLRTLPAEVKAQRFNHVIANPPYYGRDKGSASLDPGRDIAFAGQTPLSDWIAAAARRLAPRGCLTMIQRAERLPEILAGLEGRLGSVVVLPLAGRTSRPADRVIVQARKEGRAPFRLLAQLILHEGTNHLADRDDYAPQVAAILRDAAALTQFN